ncbi:MAG: acyltransferase [Bacteroidales bacterium]|nr:acyltransferase [Bacteroidales bacterium]
MNGHTHFQWLDLIRFLAAFLVIASHYRAVFLPEYSDLMPSQHNPVIFGFYFLTRLGNEAVMIFFVLSGFLVGGKLIERCQNRTFNLTQYTVDRSVRIMLPLISALLLQLIVEIVYDKPIEPLRILGNLLSLQGIVVNSEIVVLWSLSYEVWFYIIAGAIAVWMLAKTKKQIIWSYILIGTSFLVFSHLKAYYIFIWLTGALVYRHIPIKSDTKKIIVSLLFSLMLIPLMQLSSGSRTSFHVTDILGPHSHSIFEVAFGLLFGVFISQIVVYSPRHKWSVTLNRIGTKLAAFSYTLYLVHLPLRDLMFYFGAEKAEVLNSYTIILYFAFLLIGLFGSYLIYLIFERNTKKVKGFIFNLISQKRKDQQQ